MDRESENGTTFQVLSQRNYLSSKKKSFFLCFIVVICYFKNYFIFYCVLYISDPDHHSCGIKIIKKINPCDNLKFSLKQYQ